MENMMILLPEKIYLLRSRRQASIPVDPEYFALYFDNFIHPLHPEYDVVVQCDYGGNFGNCWKISEFPEDVDEFNLTIQVYDEWGRRLSEKGCTIVLVDKRPGESEYRLLCMGDSMTHRHHYVDHMALKLSRVRTCGIRSFNGGTICHEGRGGWQLNDYVTRYGDWWGGASPFMFPEGIDGREYYGDKNYNERLKTPDLDSYSLDGYACQPLGEGQVYHDGEKLWRHTASGEVLVDASPKWAFSFSKYMERFEIGKLDGVSLLLAANDLQISTYEEVPERIERFMNQLEQVIHSIHDYDAGLDIIINLPVGGAEQFAWGLRGNRSARCYRLAGMQLCRAMLERWDGRSGEHVHICPMRCMLDPINGFDFEGYRPNPYSANIERHQSNWVHPNLDGYRQMGDALACVVEKLYQDRAEKSAAQPI